jgi:hypothetical protein
MAASRQITSTIWDDDANATGVRRYLATNGVPEAVQDRLVGEWRREKLGREQILARAKAAIAERPGEPEPDAGPEEGERDAASPTAAPSTLHREDEPEWTGEVRQMFVAAGLPVGLRDAFVAYHLEMGSGRDEAMAAYRKALRGMKQDPAEQQDLYGSLLREATAGSEPF